MLNDVIYDGFSFAANGLVLEEIDHMQIGQRDNQIVKLANQPGGKLVQSLPGTKPIFLSGYYTGDTVSDVQSMYDTLTQALNRQERPLTIPHAGSTRTYTATPENVVIKQPKGLNRITFTFEFVVPEGSSEEETAVTFIDETITTASTTISFSILGSVPARPLINLIFTSVTDGTSKTVTLRNARDFIGLTFSRTFVSGDTITIDSANFQIYINGVLTQPDGRMPSWSAGPGALYYSDTFTDRSVNITGSYLPRYQ